MIPTNCIKRLRNSESPGVIESTVYEDKTMMKDDMELVAKCSDTMGFIPQDVNKAPFLKLRVINEIDNLRITDVQSFLSRIQDPQDGTIRFLLSLWTWTVRGSCY